MKPIVTSEAQAPALLDSPDQNSFLREGAAHYLAEHPTQPIIQRLVQALQDDDRGVRWAAATALSKMGESILLEPLRALAGPKARRRSTPAPVRLPHAACCPATSLQSDVTTNKRILISGSGIAGPTLAYWLQKSGFEPSIIEKRPDLHDQGYMIDSYGSGFDVAEKTGLLEPLRDRHYPVRQLKFVDRHGTAQSAFDIEKFRKLLKFRHFNFMRGDLEQVLYEATRDLVPVRFGVSVTQLVTRPECVEVELTDGGRQEYDLVIGADGIHPGVGSLLWGPESRYTHFLGYSVACSIVDYCLGAQDAFYGHMDPGKQASVSSIRGGKLATFFAFKSGLLGIQGRDQQIDTLTQVFGNMGWIVPRLVEVTCKSPDFYFDSVAQIDVTPGTRVGWPWLATPASA